MAPEIMHDYERAEYDFKVDMFSFAVLLYEMVHFQRPFSNGGCSATITWLTFVLAAERLKDDRPKLNETARCNKWIIQIISGCWVLDQSIRMSAEQALVILKDYFESLPPSCVEKGV